MLFLAIATHFHVWISKQIKTNLYSVALFYFRMLFSAHTLIGTLNIDHIQIGWWLCWNNVRKMHWISVFVKFCIKCILHRLKFQIVIAPLTLVRVCAAHLCVRCACLFPNISKCFQSDCELHSNWSFNRHNFYFWNIYAAHRLFSSLQHLILKFRFLSMKTLNYSLFLARSGRAEVIFFEDFACIFRVIFADLSFSLFLHQKDRQKLNIFNIPVSHKICCISKKWIFYIKSIHFLLIKSQNNYFHLEFMPNVTFSKTNCSICKTI